MNTQKYNTLDQILNKLNDSVVDINEETLVKGQEILGSNYSSDSHVRDIFLDGLLNIKLILEKTIVDIKDITKNKLIIKKLKMLHLDILENIVSAYREINCYYLKDCNKVKLWISAEGILKKLKTDIEHCIDDFKSEIVIKIEY